MNRLISTQPADEYKVVCEFCVLFNFFFYKMGKDWRYGRKARRKLSAPKIKKNIDFQIYRIKKVI